MRILIGNDVDDALLRKQDIAAWAERVLWFAADGDLVVLVRPPDPAFLRNVTALTGTDPGSLRIHVLPEGRFGRRLPDPHTLTDEDFLRGVEKDLAGVTGIEALWPSPAVSRFAARLGLSDRWPGADFFAQGGGEVVNNNANFRAFAAAAGVPVSPGAVCRSVEDAVAATEWLLAGTDSLMVKMAHSGAGAGNEIVTRDPGLETGHAGGRHLHRLGPGPAGVRAYWERRWDWASDRGRFAVVVEEFRRAASTVYAEFLCEAAGPRLQEVGTLIFADRVLTEELLPYRGLAPGPRERLVTAATRLAGYYHRLGHRGRLSADALVDAAGEVTFTEVNAQVTGSTHLYAAIAHQVVRADDEPRRTVVQTRSADTWSMTDTADFLAGTALAGCRYDPGTRLGVIPVMPVVPAGTGGLLYCTVFGTEEDRRAVAARMDTAFRRRR